VRALAASLCVLLAAPALAEGDAPIIVKAGEQVPVSGLLLPDAVAVQQAKRVTACEAERDSLKRDAGIPVAVVVLAVALGVVVGGAAGYGISVAVAK